MPQRRVLIVEDEAKTAETIALYLRDAGFAAEVAADGRTALQRIRADPPDLIVLDLMLPHIDGLTVCHAVRTESRVPIIMLTARTSEADRIRGLDAGADDYVAKPFSPRELVARVRAVLRRGAARRPDGPAMIRAGSLQIDRPRREVRVGRRVVPLTPSEFRILETLALSPGRIYSRAALLDEIGEASAGALERTIDAHITNLRAKIEVDRGRPRYIVTVFGAGYRFTEEPLDS